MIGRYSIALVLGALITFGLFYLMQSLVAREGAPVYERQARRVLDFVRLKREEKIETRKRDKPRRVKRKEPPPPARMPVAKLSRAPVKQALRVSAPPFRPHLDLTGGPHLGGSAGDSDVVPLVRPLHRYPSRAQARGVEGWVHLRFDVTAQGTTANILVLDSDPPKTFDRAATNAVKKYKYKPRIENGVAVDRPGVEVVLSFEMEG